MTVDAWHQGRSPAGLVAFVRLLADRPDADVMAQAAAEGLLLAWRPELVTVYLLAGDGAALELAGGVGLTEQQRQVYARVPLDVDLPITRAVLRDEYAFLRVADLVAEFPLLAAWAANHPHRDTAVVVGLPLRSRGRTIGVVSVSFSDAVEEGWELYRALDGLAAALSVWAVGQRAPDLPAAPRPRRDPLHLTPRQTDVLAAVRRGSTNAAIAETLGVSIGTVKNELSALFRLLGASDRDELVDLAARAGL